MGEELIGACGLYCGACSNYRAFQDGGEHLLGDPKFRVDDISTVRCGGCHSGKLSGHCGNCEIRLCAEKKELLHCGLCRDYPCGKVRSFQEKGEIWEGARHRTFIFVNIRRLGESGASEWLRFMDSSWRCPCGVSYSYYEENCHACGAKLDSYINGRGR